MKNLFTYILIGMLIIAIGFAWYFKNAAEKKESKLSVQSKEIQAEASIIARNVDKNGLQHVTIEAARNIVPIDQVDKIAISQGIMDTTALAIGILKKQIQDLTVINSTLRVENAKAKEVTLAGGGKVYTYKDQYVNLAYTPSLGLDTLDKGKFDFEYNADLTITQYWKRNWFLGAKKSYIDIYSNDPRTKVNSVKKLTIEQRSPDFGLRIQAAANYNPQTGSIGVGPAARVDLGRFSVQGNYTYYPESSRWRPSINANFDLIRF